MTKMRVYHCSNAGCGMYRETTELARKAEAELRANGWTYHLSRWWCPACGTAGAKTAKRNKYNTQATEAHGLKFDSKKEARRYDFLRYLEQSGEIRNLRHHICYNLITPFAAANGKRERGVSYEADFVYEEQQAGKWVTVVEDVKSVATRKRPEYVIKRKLLQWLYPNIWFLES